MFIFQVSAPGVWLPSKEELYLSVSMLGQYRNTRLMSSIFPLLVDEKFKFEKVNVFSRKNISMNCFHIC